MILCHCQSVLLESSSFDALFLFVFVITVLQLGHGGSRTAEYLKDNLFKNLSSHPDFIKDTKSAIGMCLELLFVFTD